MQIEANMRVVKSSTSTEVFITRDADPHINFALYLPPDADIKPGDTIEFVAPADQQPAKQAKRLSTAPPPVA